MGLFDEIRFTRELPDGSRLSNWYQTKDLDCDWDMAQFEVRKDGRIYRIKKGDEVRDEVLDPHTGVVDIVGGDGEYRLYFIDGVFDKVQKFPLPPTPEEEAAYAAYQARIAAMSPAELAQHEEEKRIAMEDAGRNIAAILRGASQRKGFARRILEQTNK